MTLTQARPLDTTTATRRLPGAVSFWLVGATLLALMSAASAPSPLYIVYQGRWGFSTTTLTAVFAVYAIALLAALLTVGALSDHVGRRRVLVVSLLLEAVSMVVFLGADGVGWLYAARILQGLANGAATGAISAALVDLQPGHRPRLGALVNSAAPMVGLAVGALGSGLLVQYAGRPTTVVFGVLIAVFAVLAAVVAFLPETVVRRAGAVRSLRPRLAVPGPARRHFVAAVPGLVAAWATGGLYLSLGSSLTAEVLHVDNHLVGGLVVSALAGAGAVAALVARDATPRTVMVQGSLVLAAGTGVTLLALAATSTPWFFVGTVVAGLGFGATFLGALRSLAQLAAPAERAELFASIYVVSYLAFSIPAVIAGAAVASLGLLTTATAYGVVIIVLALLAAIPRSAVRRQPA
ncbi:MAG TPA: MFS transporter [Mycobacteriales bacterium]